MELFSEIYSLYYRAVEKVLKKAGEHPLSADELQSILSENSFSESVYFMLPKLQNGDWPLLREEDKQYSAVCVPSEARLTAVQRSWLKALLDDQRFALFFNDEEMDALIKALSNVEPLYRQENFYVFDNAADGDDYTCYTYREHFQSFLKAIREQTALYIEYEGGKGHRVSGVFWPCKLEYSQKDDKFRAVCFRGTPRRNRQYVLNLGRVSFVGKPEQSPAEKLPHEHMGTPHFREVVLEITKERNALERCMVHFAHFEKRTEYDEKTDRYTCTIRYNAMDETEIVIRVLSFGPTVKVLGSERFKEEICRRIKAQTDLLKQPDNVTGES